MTSRRLHAGGGGSLADALAAAEPGAVPVAERPLTNRVRRVTLGRGRRASVVVKRVGRVAARKTELLISRLLPAAGLEECGPPLLASAPAGEQSVWQVFEDLGDCALRPDQPEPAALEAATRMVGRLHVSFADNRLLRGWIGEFGELDERFYGDWVSRAARAVAAIEASGLSPGRLRLRDRLSRRLDALLGEEPDRTRRLREVGWPESLLHGDLWPQNVLLPFQQGRRARLIDWDQAAVGPIVYDLSTFVARLSRDSRIPALRLYERTVRTNGWRLPAPAALNDAFETAEYARLAICLVSPAEAAAGGAAWAFEELGAIDGWFTGWRPLLPGALR